MLLAKTIASNLICWIFTLILFGFGTGNGFSSEETVLRLWNIPNTSSSSPDAKAAARVIELFQREHPDVVLRKASGISIPQIGGSAATLMAIAGGVAPDVLECSEEDIPSFVEQNFLLPLDEYLKNIPEEALWERAPRQVHSHDNNGVRRPFCRPKERAGPKSGFRLSLAPGKPGRTQGADGDAGP